MSESMIERVARAIVKAEFYDPEPDAYESLESFYDLLEAELFDVALWKARTAIEALREPDVLMNKAGTAVLFRDTYGTSEQAKNAWTAMIDAALKEHV